MLYWTTKYQISQIKNSTGYSSGSINDIGQNISFTIRLFADDCIMYRIVGTSEEACNLQHDLWTGVNLANINKCAVSICTL